MVRIRANKTGKILLISSFDSMLEKVFTEDRYHPVLENFQEYESLKRDEKTFNQSEKYEIPSLLIAGMNHPPHDQVRAS